MPLGIATVEEVFDDILNKKIPCFSGVYVDVVIGETPANFCSLTDVQETVSGFDGSGIP